MCCVVAESDLYIFEGIKMRLPLTRETNLSLEDLEARLTGLEENEDRFFLVIMAILIFLMHVGFGFLEAGSAR
jgi:hypothetical protein